MANKTNVDYVDFVRQDTAPVKPAVRSRRQERVYLDGDGEMQRKSDDGTVTAVGGSSGGTVPILTGSGAPTDGVTGAGVALPGWTYIDTTGAAQYLQIGTLGSPVWGLLGAHGVRVLNAPTDGVLVDDVWTGTSTWTVPLNSGVAATRDHATVIVTRPHQDDEAPYGAGWEVGFGSTEFAEAPSAGIVGGFVAGDQETLVLSVYHYRAATPSGPAALLLDVSSGTLNGGHLNDGTGPLPALVVKAFDVADQTVLRPLPLGGRVEFWLG